jgi:ligand-binding sensor domain-containing protein/signal transduction histidine kinase
MPLVILGVWSVSFLLGVPAAVAQHQFDSWTTENGLPQNSINDIVQTRDGYLWLATFGGLVRFDGVRFVVFDRDIDGIKTQRIRALYEDRSGTLWAGSEDGMLIRRRGGVFTTFTAADGLPHTEAYRIDEDARGHLWIRWRGIITEYDGTRFINYRPGDFERDVRPHEFVVLRPRIRDEPKAGVWWSQDAAGVHALVNGRVESVSFDEDLLPTTRVTGISADRTGTLWIRTGAGPLIKATKQGKTAYTTAAVFRSSDGTGFSVEDRSGTLWFQGVGDRLYRIKDGRYEAISTFPVSVLYEDREGSIWLGTNAGLHRTRNPTVALYTEGEGLSSNGVYSILQTRSGTIWIGTWGGGVNKLERNRFTPYRHREGLQSDFVSALYEDRTGRLWVGTSEGLSYFGTDRFHAYTDEHGFLKGDVRAIHQDRAGSLWFATAHGVVKFTDGAFTRYTSRDGLSHDRVTTLFEDRAGALWIGAFQGLTRLKDGAFTAYTERDGLVGNQVRAIYEDESGILWIGTYDSGLYRLKDMRLTRYRRKDGLHDNGVFQILGDADGNLWMGSNRGIYRVNRRELNEFADGTRQSITSIALGTNDGLSTLECNGGSHPAGLKTEDGRLWFPTMGGVAVIDPKAIVTNRHPPPVVIEEFRTGGQVMELLGGVTIRSETDSFDIRYTAPSFVDPEQVSFKYRLVGLDDRWHEAGDRRVASYHRIPPGRYRFAVIAANNDGVWNTGGAGVDIIIVPPIWRTWWFIVLACTAAGALMFLSYERRVRRLRREHALQKAFSQRLIDTQERERRRISYEMHDSLGQDLNIIKVRARLSKEKLAENDAVRRELDEIDAIAEKSCREIKEIAYGLRPYQLDKIGLSKTIEGMVGRVAAACDIAFTTDIANIDELFEPTLQIHVYRIVQESVSNVIKHSKARWGKVTIERQPRAVVIRIEDDGQGFRAEADDVSDRAPRTFGLMGIRERAKILGGDVEIHSGYGEGTAVVVTFRLQERADGQ